jgi:hypothetical protein
MEDRATEWLRYLESKLSDAQADLRARSTVTIPSAVVLLAGSIIFVDTRGEMILGLIGIGIAVMVLIGSAVYNLKSVVFISGCDRMIRRILLGHSSTTTTERHYCRKDTNSAMLEVNRAFERSMTSPSVNPPLIERKNELPGYA